MAVPAGVMDGGDAVMPGTSQVPAVTGPWISDGEGPPAVPHQVLAALTEL
jgi:hypothetical protein